MENRISERWFATVVLLTEGALKDALSGRWSACGIALAPLGNLDVLGQGKPAGDDRLLTRPDLNDPLVCLPAVHPRIHDPSLEEGGQASTASPLPGILPYPIFR